MIRALDPAVPRPATARERAGAERDAFESAVARADAEEATPHAVSAARAAGELTGPSLDRLGPVAQVEGAMTADAATMATADGAGAAKGSDTMATAASGTMATAASGTIASTGSGAVSATADADARAAPLVVPLPMGSVAGRATSTAKNGGATGAAGAIHAAGRVGSGSKTHAWSPDGQPDATMRPATGAFADARRGDGGEGRSAAIAGEHRAPTRSRVERTDGSAIDRIATAGRMPPATPTEVGPRDGASLVYRSAVQPSALQEIAALRDMIARHALAGDGVPAAGAARGIASPLAPSSMASPVPTSGPLEPAGAMRAIAVLAQAPPSETVSLRLKPAELGTVEVEMVRRGGVLSVELRVETPEALRTVEAERGALEAMLRGREDGRGASVGMGLRDRGEDSALAPEDGPAGTETHGPDARAPMHPAARTI